MSYEKLMSILASGKEVFFENTFEEFVFRSIPDNLGYEAKKKGGAPYFLTNTPNKLVDAFLEGKIITKEEYENY